MAGSDEPDRAPQWFVYLLACGDGTRYCGIAKDVKTRLTQHRAGTGAKYTRGRGPLRLLGKTGPLTRGDALRLELAIKAVPKTEKLAKLRSSARPARASAKRPSESGRTRRSRGAPSK